MKTQAILSEKRVVVTGASSGLGEQCAIAFARHGASVVIIARRRSRLVEVERTIRKFGGDVLPVIADLTMLTDIKRVRSIVNTKVGGCDILINNAGVYLGDVCLLETNIEDWSLLLNTNLRAPYLLCQSFIPGMIGRGYGRVVNITSATNNLVGVGLFRISKIGLEVLTAVLAAELEDTGVSATAFNPGWMKTETCSSGYSPMCAARALVDLVQWKTSLLNGTFINLTHKGRGYRLNQRIAGHGQFGSIQVL